MYSNFLKYSMSVCFASKKSCKTSHALLKNHLKPCSFKIQSIKISIKKSLTLLYVRLLHYRKLNYLKGNRWIFKCVITTLNGYQSVNINKQTCNLIEISSTQSNCDGMPQGSILGPQTIVICHSPRISAPEVLFYCEMSLLEQDIK